MGAISNGETLYLLGYIAVSVIGVAFVYLVSRMIIRLKVEKPFLYIGGATIGVLLLHKPMLEMQPIGNLYISFLVVFIVALGLYQILKRVKILDYLLFGGTSIPIQISNKLEVLYGKV